MEQQKLQGDRTDEDEDTDQLELMFRFPSIELLARKRKEQDIWQERDEEEGGNSGPSVTEANNGELANPFVQEAQESSNSSYGSSQDDESAQPLKKRRLS